MPHRDPATRRAYMRRWRARNRGRYAARQKATDAARHANQRAARYGAPGILTIDEAAAILAVERCHWCGTTDSDPWWTLDHLKPLHDGGLNRPANIRCSCHSCNASKYRSDRPGRWSRAYDYCRECLTTDKPHRAHGRCESCYFRWASRQRRLTTTTTPGDPA